ncbi:hypothetical protein AB0M02_02540 [Actinoplanes sp. NPDC051861]|uniref:hypothetical protein n=1 Tax=Actinoplanes sp. NPDC051861 TaxID=3155170 RepID=UPI00343C2BF5
MRRAGKAAVLAGGVGVSLALGAGLTAWASWSVPVSSGRGTAATEKMPRVGTPSAELSGKDVQISWPKATFSSGAPVGGYVVTRLTADARAVACTVPSTRLTCLDEKAPQGKGEWSYVVHATAGAHWTGPASEPVQVRRGKQEREEAASQKAPQPAQTEPAIAAAQAGPTPSASPTTSAAPTEAVTATPTATPVEETTAATIG